MIVSDIEYKAFLESLKTIDLRNLIRKYHDIVKIKMTKKTRQELMELIIEHTVLKQDGNIYLKDNFKLSKDNVIKQKQELSLSKQREKLMIEKMKYSGKIRNLTDKLNLLISKEKNDKSKRDEIKNIKIEIENVQKLMKEKNDKLIEVNDLYNKEKLNKKV